MQEHKTYLGNPLLKSAYVPQDFSEEQVGEYVRCQQDPLHFVNDSIRDIRFIYGEVNDKLQFIISKES